MLIKFQFNLAAACRLFCKTVSSRLFPFILGIAFHCILLVAVYKGLFNCCRSIVSVPALHADLPLQADPHRQRGYKEILSFSFSFWCVEEVLELPDDFYVVEIVNVDRRNECVGQLIGQSFAVGVLIADRIQLFI